MEAIGAASAIAGLIQLAGAVTAATYSYLSSVKSAKKEIQSLLSELTQLSGVLQGLKASAEGNPESALAIVCLGGYNPTSAGSGQEFEEQQEIDAANNNAEEATEKRRSIGRLLMGKGKGKMKSTGSSRNAPAVAVPTKPFNACEDLLTKLENRLKAGATKNGTTGDRSVGKLGVAKITFANSLMWPLEKKETMECVEKMERLKNLFTLAMTADQMTLLDEIKTFSNDMTNIVRDTHNITVRNMHNIQRIEQEGQENAEWRRKFELDRKDSFRSGVLKWLSTVDAEANHRAARSLWQPGTGEWFLRSDVFQTHLEDEESFMWLHGIPGAGKTVLMSSIISEIQNFCSQRPAKFTKYFNLAYFYFDFKDPQKRTVENMIRSLLRQFADLLPGELPREIEELYEKYGTQAYIPMGDLRAALGSMMQDFGRTFINVDALDECTEADELMDFISWLKNYSSCSVQFLATGRRDASIEDRLSKEEFVTISIEEGAVDHDVRIYVVDIIASDPRLRGLKPHVKEEIVDTLVKGAKGMFRWVKCQLDSIRSCRTSKQILAQLKDLPKTLDDTYEAALLRIREEDEPLAIRAFRWLTLAFRPLTVEQLAEAVVIEEGASEMDDDDRLRDPRDILDICGNLITVDDRSRIVGLAHFSVQEYLLSTRARGGKAAKYAVDPEEGHAYLLSTCLTYLQLEEFDNGPARRRTMRMDRLLKYPMVFYAANNWFSHAKASPELEKTVFELAPKLFGEFAVNGTQGTIKRTYCFNSWMQIFTRRPAGLRVKRRPGQLHSEARATRETFTPSPLFVACALGLTHTADAMIAEGFGGDIDAADKLVGGILTATVDGGHYDLTEMLLDRGANPSQPDGDGRTSLHRAAKIADDKMVTLLLKRGADPLVKDSGGWNALHSACACVAKPFCRGNVEDIVKALVKAGCSAADALPDKRTPLFLAAQSRNGDAAWALVSLLGEKKGAHVSKDGTSIPDEASGKTMLHWAAFCGKLDVVRKYLNQTGCNVSALDALQRTPLHDAVDMQCMPVVEELLVRGKADITLADHRGHSPLAVAGMRGNVTVLARLLRDQENVDKAHLSRVLAVSLFARRNFEVARFLLDRGADPNAQRTPIGRTVLQLVSQREDWPLVDLLTQYGGSTELFVNREWALAEKARMEKEKEDGKEATASGVPVRMTRSASNMSSATFDESVEGDDGVNLVGSVSGLQNTLPEEGGHDDEEGEDEEEEDVKAEVRAEMRAHAEEAAEVEAKLAMESPPPFEERRGKKNIMYRADVKIRDVYDVTRAPSRHLQTI